MAADIIFDLAQFNLLRDSLIRASSFATELLNLSNKRNYVIGIAKSNALLGKIAMRSNLKDQAIVHLRDALIDTAAMLRDHQENTVLIHCIEIMFHYKMYDEAIKLTNRIETNLKNNYHILIDQSLWFQRFQINKATNNLNEALNAHEKFKELHDKIEEQTADQDLIKSKVEFDSERRKLELAKKKAEVNLLTQKNTSRLIQMILGGLGLLLFFAIVFLFRSWKFSKAKANMQASFSQELIKNQEDERRRIARDLHDGVGQKLMLAAKKSAAIDSAEIHNLTTSTLNEIRSISRGLHPSNLENLGLARSITLMIDEWDESSDIFFTHEIEVIDVMVDEHVALHIYRIVQESINNVVKHAKAKAVNISMKKVDNQILVTIEDNGVGFIFDRENQNASSLGLKTLVERAKIINGTLHIESVPNKGTKIDLNVAID